MWHIFVKLPPLNPKPRQLEAIKHTQPPQLILAGAATGKTTTIPAKIAYMVEKEGIDPSRILGSPSPKKHRNLYKFKNELIDSKMNR